MNVNAPVFKWEWNLNTLAVLAGFAAGFVAWGFTLSEMRNGQEINAGRITELQATTAALTVRVDSIEKAQGRGPRVIDASTAHRTADGWVFGFAELALGQRDAIARAARVSNPGCYATGAIALVRPLVDAGLIPPDFPLALPSVSGYTGGGRSMIEAYEKGEAPAFEIYGLGLTHKHLPEIVKYTGLTRRPIFVPAVGNFAQGMLVQLPLHLDTVPGQPKASQLHDALARHYAGSEWVSVEAPTGDGRIDALALNNTNRMELRVYANEAYRQAVLIARLDNLGKGASGAAVQNLKLMLGM